MATTSRTVQEQRKKRKFLESLKNNVNVRFVTRLRNRCQKCGRSYGYIRFFKLCRICFRELADKGEIPGIRKSSW